MVRGWCVIKPTHRTRPLFLFPLFQAFGMESVTTKNLFDVTALHLIETNGTFLDRIGIADENGAHFHLSHRSLARIMATIPGSLLPTSNTTRNFLVGRAYLMLVISTIWTAVGYYLMPPRDCPPRSYECHGCGLMSSPVGACL